MSTQFSDEKATRKFDLLKQREEEESVSAFAKKYQMQYADISAFPIEIDAIKIVPEDKARAAFLAVFQVTGKQIRVGVRSPDFPETKKLLEELSGAGYVPELFLVSGHGLKHAWGYYKKVPKEHEIGAATIQVSEERMKTLLGQISSIEEIKKRIEATTAEGHTTEALEIILAGALAVDVSDVHIEPQPEHVRLRFRLDGVLHDVAFLPKKFYALLLSRIKLVSELKLNIHDRAQDGRFTIHTADGDVEVRTSTLPGPDGENTVLRVLNPKAIQITLEQLGMQPQAQKVVEQELKKPNGMILTTGPTGSGKTTALYAFLRKIHSPEIKIITLEDPIEYHLTGVEQSQVDKEKGYDFATGLRAIVRQDPDVILVGEIRDFETADTAVNAALTGHLVLSTLHTNNAAGTIPRLVNLGVKPASIAPALNIAMAQRLLRKLCSVCRVPTQPEKSDRELIEKELALFPKLFPVPDEKTWTFFRTADAQCSTCNSTGYKGRIGVFEIILVNEAIEELIMKSPSEYDIQKTAASQGQITMRQDGLLKVLAGITDLTELERVVGT